MDDIKVAKNKKSSIAEDILIVNNIEVVYSHVILVLKGVSLNVKKGGVGLKLEYVIFVQNSQSLKYFVLFGKKSMDMFPDIRNISVKCLTNLT